MQKYKYLKEKENELEEEVIEKLKFEINKSKTYSKFVSNAKVIKVYIFDYVELMVLDDNLVFNDSNGMQYSLYADCDLSDLIDILILL